MIPPDDPNVPRPPADGPPPSASGRGDLARQARAELSETGVEFSSIAGVGEVSGVLKSPWASTQTRVRPLVFDCAAQVTGIAAQQSPASETAICRS